MRSSTSNGTHGNNSLFISGFCNGPGGVSFADEIHLMDRVA
jgi:hypothetical protein